MKAVEKTQSLWHTDIRVRLIRRKQEKSAQERCLAQVPLTFTIKIKVPAVRSRRRIGNRISSAICIPVACNIGNQLIKGHRLTILIIPHLVTGILIIIIRCGVSRVIKPGMAIGHAGDGGGRQRILRYQDLIGPLQPLRAGGCIPSHSSSYSSIHFGHRLPGKLPCSRQANKLLGCSH